MSSSSSAENKIHYQKPSFSLLSGFTALDFFVVDRSTLTAVLATFLTYFIILGQSSIC
jgi:hypothetical protein